MKVVAALAASVGLIGAVVAGSVAGAAPAAPAQPAVPVRSSPGCHGAIASAPPGEQADRPFSADGDNGAYTLEAPAATAGTALPVVVDLHAYEEPGSLQVSLSGLGAYGQTHGFRTVTPWIVGRPVPLWHSVPGSADLAWIGDLLTHVESTACVDENRVFVTGYSNGAFMTSLIACRYSSRVAAVAPVAGIQAEQPCRSMRPVPVVAFHGTADPEVHYDGSASKAAADLPSPTGAGRMTATQAKMFGTRGIFTKGPSIPAEVAAWANRNGCQSAVTTTRIAPDVSLLAWACPRRGAVELYRIRGGGHTWPGSTESAALSSLLGPTTFSISADAAMWRFFRAHPLAPGH